MVKVIESGGNIEDMKGQKMSSDKSSKKKTKKNVTATSSSSSTTSSDSCLADDLEIARSESETENKKNQRRVVVQFSFLGYSLGGLIGRFAMAMLDLEGFFASKDQGGQGVEPVYFVTMATPHLGIRQPSRSRFTKVFNFLSARMLSRTGAYVVCFLFLKKGEKKTTDLLSRYIELAFAVCVDVPSFFFRRAIATGGQLRGREANPVGDVGADQHLYSRSGKVQEEGRLLQH